MEMFKLSRSLVDSKKFIMDEASSFKFFSNPLSDSQIIELHSMFMTPAIHHLVTKNRMSGRALMNTFLPSLQYYHKIGCLTTQKQPYSYDVLEILPILQTMIQNFGLAQAIDLFFVDYSDLEFVWIEFSQDLLKVMSEIHLKQMCMLLSRHESIPVVIIAYENES